MSHYSLPIPALILSEARHVLGKIFLGTEVPVSESCAFDPRQHRVHVPERRWTPVVELRRDLGSVLWVSYMSSVVGTWWACGPDN